jgi:hypothetical protein
VLFTEARSFIRSLDCIIEDRELQQLKLALVLNPELGVVIPGSGLRKMRWAAKGRGKRGGARVIYYLYKSREKIYLLMAYAKNEREDLTPRQLRDLRQLVED